MNNRDQLVQHLGRQVASELDQAVAFLGRHRHPGGQLAPQDLVLNFEVTDVPGKLLLRGADEQQQQRTVDVPHRGDSAQVSQPTGDDFIFAHRRAGPEGGIHPLQRALRPVASLTA